MPAAPWEWKNPIRKSELTGAWRPRYQKWWRGGGYVIQVQVQNTHVFYMDRDSEPKPTGTTYEWRDASANDLMQLGMRSGPKFDRTPPAEAAAEAA